MSIQSRYQIVVGNIKTQGSNRDEASINRPNIGSFLNDTGVFLSSLMRGVSRGSCAGARGVA